MKHNKSKLWIIIVIVSLNSIGMSIVLPLLPFIVGKYLPSQHIAAGMGMLMSVFAASTFFSAPVMGALSDKYGRKPILVISLLGSVIGYVLFGIGGSLWVLFLGRIIDGLTAGNITALFAYISDSAEPKERAKWFGYVGAAMGIGKIGGPAIGGLLGSISIGLPFFITAGLILLSMFAVLFALPESLAPEKRNKHLTARSFNAFAHFKDIFSLGAVKSVLIIGVLFYVGLSIFQFNFTLFLKDSYNLGPATIGSILTIAGICEIASRAFLLPRLLTRFNEKSIAIIGLTCLGTGLGLIMASAYIHSITIILFAIILIISGEGLFEPTYMDKLSQSVDENKQGKLQGVNQSLQSANNVFVPLVAAAIYFISAGMLYGIAALAIFSAFLMYKRTLKTNLV
ncbi:MAG: tetracycline resistance MFS efflux pump [Bacteroidetes bacterium 43-93]|nr:MFS transporter [Bacteroidota bacterium]OJW98268.1 MAG: tetracycline resistance MFS efflux pump [Bacteroidetes bacterium 43-93]